MSCSLVRSTIWSQQFDVGQRIFWILNVPFPIKSVHRHSRLRSLAYLFIAFAPLAVSSPSVALDASKVLDDCRASVGRPVVRACIKSRLQAQGGMPIQHLSTCREVASPAVRGCFQTAMKDVIASCRASVGKPIVQACVGERVKSEGRFLFEFIADCRKTAYNPVRACVWRNSSAPPPTLSQ